MSRTSSNTQTIIASGTWISPPKGFRWIRVWLEREDAGGFSVHVPSLPGAASQGETEEEALANITEALGGVLESYRDDHQPVPWGPYSGRCPVGMIERHIAVREDE